MNKFKISIIFLHLLYSVSVFSQAIFETDLINELGIGLEGANGIVVEGNYAYISAADPECGLYILDISNTDSLRIAGYVTLPSCGYNDVAYKSGYVYVGSSIIDAINPENPVLIGDLGMPSGNKYFEMSGDTLLVTVVTQLWIFEISDPENPNNLGFYLSDNHYGELTLYGQYVFICRNGGLDVIDISDASNPTLIGEPSFEYISDTDSDIEISGDFAFVAAGDRLRVLSISNPQYPGLVTTLNDAGYGPMKLYGSYAFTKGGGSISDVNIIDISQIDAPAVVATYDMQFGNWTANPKDFWISDTRLYMVGSGHVGLEIVDISNPLSPTLSGSFIRGNIKAIEKKDNFLYLLTPYEVGGSSTYRDDRIQIVDITDPSNPTIHNNVFTTYNGISMTLFDNYLGVATFWSDPWSNRDASFDIIDISNPSNAQLISSSSFSTYPIDIEVFNNKAFIGVGFGQNAEVLIFDVSDPYNTQKLTSYNLSYDLCDIAVDSTILAVKYSSGSTPVDLVDISDLPSTTYLSSIPTGGTSSTTYNSMIIINNYLYIGLPDGIHVYNISDPLNPSFVQYYVTDNSTSFNWNDNILMYGDGEFLNINESGELESAGNLDINISSNWRSLINNSNLYTGYSSLKNYAFNTITQTPQNLAVIPAYQQITLRWSPNTESDLHKYNIYRDTSFSAATLIDSVVGSPPDTFYIDTGLTNGQIYYYRISAIDTNFNESDFSNEVSAIPDDYESPHVSLITPNGGEEWLEGSEQVIHWSASDNVGLYYNLISYSVDGGSQYERIDSLSGAIDSIEWIVPNSITTEGHIKVVSFDERGNFGVNQNETPFSIIDNTPPTVVISTPVELGTLDTTEIIWTATDNSGLRSHHIYFSYDNCNNFSFVDSVDGSENIYNWIVPNIVSDECRIKIISFDLVNLSDSDTSDIFSIVDGICPQISILSPTEGFSIPEYEEITVKWNVYDNIEMDSVRIYYSNTGYSSFIY